MSTSLQLATVTQVFLPYSWLLSPLNLIFIDTSPINSPNGTLGDMKMSEPRLQWHSYGRWRCDGPLITYSDGTFYWRQTHRSLASVRKHNRLWHLYRPSERLDFGSSNTHCVHTRWNQVGVLCPRLWLENMGHSRSYGRTSVFQSWLWAYTAGYDRWMSNGLLFWVPLEHGTIYACYHRMEW